jgi:hypothetical protein
MTENDPYRPPDEFADVNPYAAPQAELAPVERMPTRNLYGLPPFSIDAVMSRAWEQFQRRMGLTMAIVLGVLGVIYGYQIAGNLMMTAMANAGTSQLAVGLFSIAFSIGGMLLNLWITVGQTVALLKLARGEETEFADVFSGGRYFLRFVGASILCALVLMTIAIACFIPAIATAALLWTTGGPVMIALVAIFAIIGVIGLIAVAVRFYQYPYVLVDRDCGVTDSLQISWELTRGHVFELVALGILEGLIAAAGLLACLVGAFFTVPVSVMMVAVTYALLAGDGTRKVKEMARDDLEFL